MSSRIEASGKPIDNSLTAHSITARLERNLKMNGVRKFHGVGRWRG